MESTTKQLLIRVTIGACSRSLLRMKVFGPIKLLPDICKLDHLHLLLLELLSGWVPHKPCLNINHPADHLVTKPPVPGPLVLDHVRETSVHAKVNVEVGKTLWDALGKAAILQLDQLLIVRPFGLPM